MRLFGNDDRPARETIDTEITLGRKADELCRNNDEQGYERTLKQLYVLNPSLAKEVVKDNLERGGCLSINYQFKSEWGIEE